MSAATVRADQRHTKARPCPICGGGDRDPRGKGRRCHGFSSEDFAHCSREEHAGGLPIDKADTYAHKLTGSCACGTTHGTDAGAWREIEAAYDYRDERGRLLFQAVRKIGKVFRQRKPDGAGGWEWTIEGVRRVPYRLPELLAAPADAPVFIVEGEKDVERLRSLGVVATCNPMGAGKWHFVEDEARRALKGRRVNVVADADNPGRAHARQVSEALTDCAVKVIDLFPGEDTGRDVSDWLDAGHALAELEPPKPATPERKRPPFISIGEALEQLETLASAPVYETPFPSLNKAIGAEFGGLMGTQVYDVVARTGRGKTSFVNQIAREAAHERDVVIAFYEAFPGYNVARMAAGPMGVSSNAIIREPGRYGAQVLKTLPGRVHLLNRPDLAGIRDAADYLGQKSGTPPLVIVDYLGKLADQIQAKQNRPDARLATSEASSELMDIAAATRAAVIAVSAMSRMNGRRTNDPRKLSPFEMVDVAKESGSVEYDSAGLIVLSLSDESDEHGRIATMTVAKARFGEECHIDMRFDGRSGAWTDRGRVAVTERTKNMRPTIHAEILSKLDTPAQSKTKLSERVKRSPTDTFKAIKEMIADGRIIETERGLERGE